MVSSRHRKRNRGMTCMWLFAVAIILKTVRSDEEMVVYGAKGSSVVLQSQLLENYTEVEWIYLNGSIFKLNILHEHSPGKVLLNKKKHSVTLANLDFSDMGIYYMEATDDNGEQKKISIYKLIVQVDPEFRKHEGGTEVVSDPQINVARTLLGDGKCFIALNCSFKKGTDVSITWTQLPSGLYSYGSEVNVTQDSLSNHSSGHTYKCQVKNEVSAASESWSDNKEDCAEYKSENKIWMIATLTAVALFILVLIVCILRIRKKDSRGRYTFGNASPQIEGNIAALN